MSLATPSLPAAKVIHVDTRGAVILSEESPEVRALPVRSAPHSVYVLIERNDVPAV
jgi:hypothetical protein